MGSCCLVCGKAGAMDDNPFAPNADEPIRNNTEFGTTFGPRGKRVEPFRQLAIVACTDYRMAIFPILGLDRGDASAFCGEKPAVAAGFSVKKQNYMAGAMPRSA